MATIKIPKDSELPVSCMECLICGAVVEERGFHSVHPVVCDECREAVAFAKWLRTGRVKDE